MTKRKLHAIFPWVIACPKCFEIDEKCDDIKFIRSWGGTDYYQCNNCKTEFIDNENYEGIKYSNPIKR